METIEKYLKAGAGWLKKLGETGVSLFKVCLSPGGTNRPASPGSRPGRLIILGNGPSLRKTLDEHGSELSAHDLMAVNFAANADEFFSLKPRHYVLADPHFFRNAGSDAMVQKLWDNLGKTSWPMTLHLPAGTHRRYPEIIESLPSEIELRYFPMTAAEGFRAVTGFLYGRGLALPRPRNVLIPALMEGIGAGYGEIFICGADHTWPHTLYVDDFNRVVSVQPHFYKENPKELDRIAEEYRGVTIADVLGSMAVAFGSYHKIREYADEIGVKIYNATPGSLIDAFERRPL